MSLSVLAHNLIHAYMYNIYICIPHVPVYVWNVINSIFSASLDIVLLHELAPEGEMLCFDGVGIYLCQKPQATVNV